jgi:hypothetical protein
MAEEKARAPGLTTPPLCLRRRGCPLNAEAGGTARAHRREGAANRGRTVRRSITAEARPAMTDLPRARPGRHWFDGYPLSGRAYNLLQQSGLTSAEEVRARSRVEWAVQRGCGKATIAELERVFGPLAQHEAQQAIADLELEYRYAQQAYLAASTRMAEAKAALGRALLVQISSTEMSRSTLVREAADRLGVSTEVVNDLIAAAEGHEAPR